MIVSDVAGTTRDSVDSVYRYYGREYVLVDTAGIRSRGRISQGVEKYSVMRAMKSVSRCDVATVCPVCGTRPVASVIRVGGGHEIGRHLGDFP